jgi:hypothetical protein
LNYFNYFSEIEETFIRLRGKSLLLSPLDWTLIEGWQKRGIPQHVVIRSIEKIFADIKKDPKRNPSIKSLAYCADEVEQQFRTWLAASAGASRESTDRHDESEADLAEFTAHLDSLTEGLDAAAKKASGGLQQSLTDVLERLKAIRQDRSLDPEALESELTRLESGIDKVLLETAAEAELTAANKAVEEHLAQYAGKMQQDVYEKTFELMVVKKLREKAGIPAFSLFYL